MIWNWVLFFIGVAISYDGYKKAKEAAKAAQDAAKGVLLNKNSNIEHIPVIYGERRVGGTRVFVSSKDVPGGDNNEYLYVALVLCEGEIESVTDIKINEDPITDTRFNNLISYNVHLGADDQVADTLLQEAPDWDSSHRLRGVAYLAVRFKYDRDAYTGGVPDITCVVKGKKVYNPQTDTTAWSDNPALCLRDYLTNTRYGKGLPASAINQASFNTAADTCDTYEVTPYDGASDLRIFQTHYVLDTGETILNNVKEILQGCRGFLPYYDGQYHLHIDGSASSQKTFNTDNIIGGIKIDSNDKRTTYNRYFVKFANQDIDYQPDQASYPDHGDSGTYDDFVEEDNDEALHVTNELKTVTNYYIARDFARILTERSRNATRVSFVADSSALELLVSDVITVNHPTPDWGDKLFQIEEITLNSDMTVNIVALEYDSTIYTYDTSLQQREYPDTNLPNVFDVGTPQNFTSTSTTGVSTDGVVIPGIRFNWDAADDSFVTAYEFQYKRLSNTIDYGQVSDAHTTNPDYGLVTDTSTTNINYGLITEQVSADDPAYTSVILNSTQYVLTGVIPGVNYNVRVRSINELGIRSSFITLNTVAESDTTAPSIPSNVTAFGGLNEITVTWERPIDSDFSHVQIWENDQNTSGSATQLAVSHEDRFTRTGLGYNVQKYYWLKSVDYTGNVSGFSSSAVATSLFVDSDAFSSEVNNLFSEAGAYGIEPVSTLPASGDFVGQIKFQTTANQLYRWTGTAWDSDIFSVTEGSVGPASFAEGSEPVSVVDTLPSPTGYSGPSIVFLTTDNKLYRYNGSAFVATVATGDLSGTIDSANFAQTLRPPEIVDALPSAEADLWQGKQVVLTSDNKIYRYNGTEWIATVAAGDVDGQLTGTQIADDAITASKILAETITGGKIAANTITGGLLAASGIITDSAQINDAVITSAKIEDAAITTAKIDDAAITNAKISGSIQSADYVEDEAGWKIDKDGQAELNNATFRGNLNANSGSLGAVTLDSTTGSISAGQTAYASGTGFFLGYESEVPKFSIGNENGAMLSWDGTQLIIKNATQTFTEGDNPLVVSSIQTGFHQLSDWTVLKIITCSFNGEVRCKVRGYRYNNAGTASLGVSLNGLGFFGPIYGSENLTTTEQEVLSHIIEVEEGDEIILYGKTADAVYFDNAFCTSFGLYVDEVPLIPAQITRDTTSMS